MAVVTNVSPPTEGIKHQEPNTNAVVKQRELGKGTLYIAENRLVWVGETGQGFSLEYQVISIHAVSRDLNRFPQECLFLMTYRSEDEDKGEHVSNSSSDEEEELTSEIRFIPENKAALDTMYKAVSECQALHSIDDSSSCNGEEEGSQDEEEEFETGAGDPGEQIVYSNGQDDEPMDIGHLDEEGPEH